MWLRVPYFKTHSTNVSKRIYKHYKYDAELDPKTAHIVTKVRLMQEFHWTPKETEAVMKKPFLVAEIFGVIDAQQKLQESRIKKHK